MRNGPSRSCLQDRLQTHKHTLAAVCRHQSGKASSTSTHYSPGPPGSPREPDTPSSPAVFPVFCFPLLLGASFHIIKGVKVVTEQLTSRWLASKTSFLSVFISCLTSLNRWLFPHVDTLI